MGVPVSATSRTCTPVIGFVVVALAALVVGVTGFGFNLLAVPLLTIFMSSKEAVVLALVAGLIVNLALAISRWREVRTRILGTVILGSIPGVAIGATLFAGASDRLLKIIIAALTGLFAIQLMVKAASRRLKVSRIRLVGLGVISGTLAATTGMGGPPLVAFLSQTLPDAHEIRATIAAYSAVSSLIALIGIHMIGALDIKEVRTGLLYVAPGIIGLLVGMRLFSPRQEIYQRLVASTLLIVAVIGLSSALGLT